MSGLSGHGVRAWVPRMESLNAVRCEVHRGRVPDDGQGAARTLPWVRTFSCRLIRQAPALTRCRATGDSAVVPPPEQLGRGTDGEAG